jgi:hypothetical protein
MKSDAVVLRNSECNLMIVKMCSPSGMYAVLSFGSGARGGRKGKKEKRKEKE